MTDESELRSLLIGDQLIKFSSCCEVLNARYKIDIADKLYEINAEAVRNEKGYGLLVYLNAVITSNPEISDNEIEIIKKVISNTHENKGLFFRFE